LQNLDLYAKIEPFLDFSEIKDLYNKYYKIINSLNKNSLIDIGCGNGKFLKSIKVKRKFGIDLSKEQIKKALSLGIEAKVIDICKVEEKFDIAVAVFDVVNYIPKKDLKNFFSCVYNILNKDGIFIFDINSLYGFSEVADGAFVIDKEDKFISIDAKFDKDKLITTMVLFEKLDNNCYKKETNEIIQYYYKNKFLKELLVSIGFIVDIEEFYLYSEIADKFIFICYKR